MTTEESRDDPYVNRGENLTGESYDDPYVIHGKNLIAEISVTAHSNLVSFFAHEGLSVSSVEGGETDTVRVHISGRAEEVDRSVGRFVEENPDVLLHILGSVSADDEGAGSHASD